VRRKGGKKENINQLVISQRDETSPPPPLLPSHPTTSPEIVNAELRETGLTLETGVGVLERGAAKSAERDRIRSGIRPVASEDSRRTVEKTVSAIFPVRCTGSWKDRSFTDASGDEGGVWRGSGVRWVGKVAKEI